MLVNVTYRGFRKRIVSNPRWAECLKQAILEHEKAILDESLALIRRHAKTNWLAAAWLLERKWPDKFALRSVVRTETDPNEKAVGGMLTEADLHQITQQVADFRRNETARTLPLMGNELVATTGPQEAQCQP
jgi:hypothetical protein